MGTLRPIRLRELKQQVKFLFKQSQKDLAVLERFRILPLFKHCSQEEICSIIRLKHAYEVIAHESSFQNWRNLKKYVVETDCLYRKTCVALVFSWFRSYEEAKLYHELHNGYLLAFWGDFVICGKEYIRCIGLPVESSDWEKIGFDWSKPRDKDAFERLKSLAIENYLNLNQ